MSVTNAQFLLANLRVMLEGSASCCYLLLTSPCNECDDILMRVSVCVHARACVCMRAG